MLPNHLLALGGCHWTTDLCGDVSARHSNGISEVDRGFGFVVLGFRVVNWKNDRRDRNERYPEDNHHPTQILHGKDTPPSRQQNTPAGLPCQRKKSAENFLLHRLEGFDELQFTAKYRRTLFLGSGSRRVSRHLHAGFQVLGCGDGTPLHPGCQIIQRPHAARLRKCTGKSDR